MRAIPGACLLAAALAAAAAAEPLETKKRLESEAERNPFAILPHRPSYLLPWSYNTNPSRRSPGDGRRPFQHAETKFQISFRMPLWKEIAGRPLSLNASYTQLSFFQVYRQGASTPFRGTDYEPELFLVHELRRPALGLELRRATLGFDHHSNGSDEFSRSWNRLYAEFLFTRGGLAVSFKPWWRIPELKGDDNPQISRYYGNGELSARFKRGNLVASGMLRNNLRLKGNKGAGELGLSGPLLRQLRWYAQYYNGFGESLVDFDRPVQRIGVGVLVGEWL